MVYLGQRARTRPTMVSACPVVLIQTLRGHRWVTRLLTCKDTSRFRFLPTSETRRNHPLDGTLEVVRQRHQRNELKRNILVSSWWCYATESTGVKYESNHS